MDLFALRSAAPGAAGRAGTGAHPAWFERRRAVPRRAARRSAWRSGGVPLYRGPRCRSYGQWSAPVALGYHRESGGLERRAEAPQRGAAAMAGHAARQRRSARVSTVQDARTGPYGRLLLSSIGTPGPRSQRDWLVTG